MITYVKVELINTSGISVGFGYEKHIDGVREKRSYAWDNRYNTEAECDAAVRFLTMGAKHSNAYAAMTEAEKEIVAKLWTMTRDELVGFGKSNKNARLTYSARYIFWDRFARFGGHMNGGAKPLSSDDFYARFVAAESSDSASGSPVGTPNGDGLEPCGRCGGSGIYAYGGVVNGKPVGGTCFRCKGKGRCTRYANELGERGRLERGLSEMKNEIDRARHEAHEATTEAMYAANDELINEYEAKKAETEASRPGTVKFSCEDCSKEIDGGQWCADCAKARYYIDEKGRGKFRQGPKPSHDEIIGREWESAVTPTARRRAERKASYATR